MVGAGTVEGVFSTKMSIRGLEMGKYVIGPGTIQCMTEEAIKHRKVWLILVQYKIVRNSTVQYSTVDRWQ